MSTNPVQPITLNPPRRMTMQDIMDKTDRERGIKPMPLESDLLLKRVRDGGYSGQFLGDAFLSSYQPSIEFPHSLSGLLRLDAEGFRLFHEILHIRHISGWSDDIYYEIFLLITDIFSNNDY